MPAKKATAKKAVKKPVKKTVKAAKKPAKKPVKKVTRKAKAKEVVAVSPVVDSSGVVTMNPVADDVLNG